MESVSSTESVGSRREPVANSVHTADRTRLNSTHQMSRIGGVYWALRSCRAATNVVIARKVLVRFSWNLAPMFSICAKFHY